MRSSTVKLFEAFRDLVAARDGHAEGSFTTGELRERSGLEPSAFEEEIALLQKMVLVTEGTEGSGSWQLTPVGAAACVNTATFETVFRR